MRRRDRQRDVADRRGGIARLQSYDGVAAASRFLDDEQSLARRWIADEQKRELALSTIINDRDGDLFVGRDVEGRLAAIEHEDLFLGLGVSPAHHRQRSEDHRAAFDL